MWFFKKEFDFATSIYADEVIAKKTSWKPMMKNGTLIQGLKLSMVDNRLEFNLGIFTKFLYKYYSLF